MSAQYNITTTDKSPPRVVNNAIKRKCSFKNFLKVSGKNIRLLEKVLTSVELWPCVINIRGRGDTCKNPGSNAYLKCH